MNKHEVLRIPMSDLFPTFFLKFDYNACNDDSSQKDIVHIIFMAGTLMRVIKKKLKM